MNKPVLNRNKIISVALAVIVLIMLFLSWMGVTGETRSVWNLVRQQIERYAGQIEEYVELANHYGLDIDTKGVSRVVKALNNGRLSPFEVFTTAGTAGKILRKLSSFGMFDEQAFSKAAGYCTVYRVFFVLTLLSVLLSIFIRITGKLKSIDFLMFLFILMMFISAVTVTSRLSSQRLISFTMTADITVWSVIALICSVPLALIERIPFLRPEADEAGTIVPVIKEGETRASIGASLSGIREKAGSFIKNIGIGSKKTYQCSVCGHDLQASDKTCPVCRSSASDKMSTAVCKNCGCRIPSGSKYCSFCGSKQN